MSMIAEQIYNGATAKDLNMGEMQYNSRKETLDEFLEEWTGDNFQQDFLDFLNKEYRYDKYSIVEQESMATKYPKLIDDDLADAELTYGKMFADLAVNLKAIASSGVKLVDKDQHTERYSICKSCEHLSKGRCSKCGCFMKLKSKFEAMSCPINLWKKE